MADPGRLDELKRKFEENPKRYFAPLANEYRKAGEADVAIELCRTYLPQQPSHMSGYIVYGQALHDAGHAEESTAVFKQALTLDPENIIALRQLGDIARDSGDSGGAMRWYGKVLDLDPRNEEVATYITSIASPGSQPTRPLSERPAPPTVRPEPEPDASAVRLEDIVSAPDTAQLPIMADEPAQHDYDPPDEPLAEFSDEPFEVTEWPSAIPVEGEETSTQNSDVSDVLEGPWHAGSEAETLVEAAHDEGTVGAEPVPVQTPAKSANKSVMDDSPFATQTMAELYLQQGLRGEALTIYRQLALKRDDPAIHARIVELEADGSPHSSGETVHAFFARIGQKQPNKRVELAAEREAEHEAEEEAGDAGNAGNANSDDASPLAHLFGSAEADAGDAAAAQRLAGAFGKPQLGNSQS